MKFYVYADIGEWINIFGTLQYCQDVLFSCQANNVLEADELAKQANIKYLKAETVICEEAPEIVGLSFYVVDFNYKNGII